MSDANSCRLSSTGYQVNTLFEKFMVQHQVYNSKFFQYYRADLHLHLQVCKLMCCIITFVAARLAESLLTCVPVTLTAVQKHKSHVSETPPYMPAVKAATVKSSVCQTTHVCCISIPGGKTALRTLTLGTSTHISSQLRWENQVS